MYRFLLTRRWIAFALFVALLSGVCIWLGFWQFGRGDLREARNELTRHNMVSTPVAPDELATSDPDASQQHEWRRVEVTGTYDTDAQVVVKYRTREQRGPGVDVVTPLRTDDGRALLVERGWVPSANTTGAEVDIPEPPAGEVTVLGWWRADDHVPLSATQPDEGQVRAISTLGMGQALDYPLYEGGYLALEEQKPATDGFVAPEGPELGSGPHFFYGVQWWFFAALALGGYGWFAWAEAHPRGPRRAGHARPGQRSVPAARAAAERAAAARAGGSRPTAPPASERADGAPVDRQHHAGDVRSGG
ncbi:SURF1 family protein [Mumia sp. zg.B53]|uniref:SURF1 family cytochrome oxidase biogenesis protein n=1 Tax=Mumia sp. zg.B53 TaxID=2855449 RepID=UPI001C6EEF6C|nr:SURF1 family protein [Mumia sp. zg.B53]MBW9213452.1 SURF1 family protein [Mumia sp. zg.B53]